MDTKTATIL